MKRYAVQLTMTHNKTVIVNAEDSEKAIEYVQDNIEKLAPNNSFEFGDVTVDYADQYEE